MRLAMDLTLRQARAQDVPALAAIYAQSVRAIGPQRYTPQQVERWAAFADDPTFGDFILTAVTFIAEVEQRPVGFCGLLSSGKIASLYVSPQHGRRGVGTRLLTAALDLATARRLATVHTDASEFSRPVFARQGFVVDHVETVERGGVSFQRYRMVRAMTPSGQPQA